MAEEIWQIAYNDALTLAELHGRSGYCDWKIYRTVEMKWCTPGSSVSAVTATRLDWHQQNNERNFHAQSRFYSLEARSSPAARC